MKKISLAMIAALVLMAGAFSQSGWAQDEPPASSELHFMVIRDYNGKPVRNAAVVMHPVAKNGKQEKGGL